MYRRGGGQCLGRRMLRPRGGEERGFWDVVKEDVKLVGVREDDAEAGVRERQMIGCGELWAS